MNKALLLFKLYLAPNQCLEAIVQESLKTEKPEREEHIREREWGRIVEVRKSGLKSLIFIIAIALVGYAASVVVDGIFAISEYLIRNLRIVASLIIAWAVLSKLTKEIESWGGKSLPEQLNSFSFRVAYFVGVAIIICTLFLKPVALPVP